MVPVMTKAKDKTEMLEVRVKILSQADIRHAHYELDRVRDKETDPAKKASLKNVCNALWEITNWYGIEAIASEAIVGDKEYLPRKAS